MSCTIDWGMLFHEIYAVCLTLSVNHHAVCLTLSVNHHPVCAQDGMQFVSTGRNYERWKWEAFDRVNV